MSANAPTPNPTTTMAFRWSWRPYQERVLAAVTQHMQDRKVHIVAAPGAGKTTLGLEIFRQLGQPALALSPTRTIRDQWIRRLADFLPEGDGHRPDWVSDDLEQPGFFTSITYQALHTKYRYDSIEDNGETLEQELELLEHGPSGSDIKRLIGQIRVAGIKTLILDEAHHLRAEWWKALTGILEELPDVVVVALTATPPYDVTGREWGRYQELCGPIDEEVSVPELVRAGTLCPHQDYVYAVKPTETDLQILWAHQQAVRRLTADLRADPVFLAAIQTHPMVASTDVDVAEVLDAPETAVALLVFLKDREQHLPRHLLRLLGVQAGELPHLTRRWWQALVESYLFDDGWKLSEEALSHRDALAKRLRRDSLLQRRELWLKESRKVKSSIALSPAKIAACQEIYALERQARGEALRQVILTDFIRDEDFVDGSGSRTPDLGAWPIFHALVSCAPAAEAPTIGLLTGRLIVLHADRLAALKQNLAPAALAAGDLPGLPGFQRVEPSSQHQLTQAITSLLASGELRVLVGTRALLGEGWDAPCINSLVLASFIGSFMLTNQMRGRAIRIDRAQPDKAASIWHIIAVDQLAATALGGSLEVGLGEDLSPTVQTRDPAGLIDLEDLTRRFGTFVGLHVKEPVIESGLERLDLPRMWSDIGRYQNNQEMARRLSRIGQLKQQWKQAIDSGDEGRVLPSVLDPKPPRMAPFYFTRTLGYLLISMAITFFGVFAQVMQSVEGANDAQCVFGLMGLAALAGLLFILPKLIRAVMILVWHLPVDGSIRQIGQALRDALHDQELLTTDRFRLKILTLKHEEGAVMVAMGGGTYYEQSLFSDCMREILGPIHNPRYLIRRKGRWMGSDREDYHAVPEILGSNKERAEALLKAWQRWVGPADLLYTRVPEGRAVLLKARAAAFSSSMAPRAERRDQWQ